MLATAIAIVGGIITIANQAQVAEPMWLATRDFVRQEATVQRGWIKTQFAPIQERLIAQEISSLRAERNATRDKLFDLETLQKREALTPELSKNIEAQKRELQDRIERLNDRLGQLIKEKASH